ncbi:unnamed protein product, partial [Linum tenue]
ESVEILGYEIPSQTKVIINAWAIGQDPRVVEKLINSFQKDSLIAQAIIMGIIWNSSLLLILEGGCVLDYHLDWLP